MASQPSTYIGEAAELDAQLEHGVNEIRRALYNREVSAASAAEMREILLEQHLESMRMLRRRHFGGDDVSRDDE